MLPSPRSDNHEESKANMLAIIEQVEHENRELK
jgi:hypothetical protein